MNLLADEAYAYHLDERDELASLRERFFIPADAPEMRNEVEARQHN